MSLLKSSEKENDSKGVHDGATLLLALGEEEAAEVLKHLSPREVQKLGGVMANMKSISREEISEILQRFENDVGTQTGLGTDADSYLRSVLTKALGEDKAGFLLDRIMHTGDTTGIESLKWMDPTAVADLIRQEHPQVIASILVHLEADQSAAILNHLNERLRGDVMLRIATLEGIQPSALRELNDVLTKVLSGNETVKRHKLGGVKTAADILNYVGGTSETQILDVVRQSDTDLAQRIIDEMFTFENLLEADNRGLQMLLREVTPDTLVVALKGASAEIRNKIFSCMPTRASQQLKEDLEVRGPVKLSEVEAQQKEVLKIARRLIESGEMAVSGMGEEQYV